MPNTTTPQTFTTASGLRYRYVTQKKPMACFEDYARLVFAGYPFPVVNYNRVNWGVTLSNGEKWRKGGDHRGEGAFYCVRRGISLP